MDCAELADISKIIIKEFITDTFNLETKHSFTPDFVIHNLKRLVTLKEQNLNTSYGFDLSYVTFNEDGYEYGCILFKHNSGLNFLSEPLFINNKYKRLAAYIPPTFSKFRKAELEKFLLQNKNLIGIEDVKFVDLYKQYLMSLNVYYKLGIEKNNFVIDKYKRELFKDGKLKSFIIISNEVALEAKII